MKDQQYRISIYGRVSSDRQADEATIESQVADLTERVQEDGCRLEDELCFLDDGYTGETLLRPALERLRDVAYAGAIDRLCCRTHGDHHRIPSIRQFSPLPIPRNPTRSSGTRNWRSDAMAAVIGSETVPIFPRCR